IGKGDGTFGVGKEYLTGTAASAVAVGDFNKDGHTDVVVANNQTPGQVIELLNDGFGNLTTGGTFGVGPNPTALAVGDFNRDGFLDVVAVSGSTTTTQNISVLLNQAGTGFGGAINTRLTTGFPLDSVAVANVNQDAFPDLVVGQRARAITNA